MGMNGIVAYLAVPERRAVERPGDESSVQRCLKPTRCSMSWRTAGEHLLLKGPVPDTNGLTVALVAMGIVGSTVGSANAGIVADIAGDWVNATAEPAGWVYLDPIRKGFRMEGFRVRGSGFRRGLGREMLLSRHFRGQKSLAGPSVAGR